MKKVRGSIDKIATDTYQRKEFGSTYVNGAMKELLLLAGIIQKLDIDDASKKAILERWNGYFKELGEALEEKDFVLCADILHHEFAQEIKTWEMGKIQ
jgi:hypothetical protein